LEYKHIATIIAINILLRLDSFIIICYNANN